MTSLNETLGAQSTPTQPSTNVATEKPKRVRRPHHRRPKALPATIRQRLAILGHQPKNNDTTDSNLSELIDKLNSDLQTYTIAADHWQKMFLALQASESKQNLNTDDEEVKRSEENSGRVADLLTDRVTAVEYEVLNRLQRVADPTLAMHTVTFPKVRSAVSKSNEIVWSEGAFETVLNNISKVASLFGMFKGTTGTWSGIYKLKPDFNEDRAKRVWADVFQPVDAPSYALNWTGSSSVRSVSLVAPDDTDYDDMDRKLLNATDDEVVEMLHYCSLLIVGFGQATVDDPRYSEARDHLGVNCERLLREIIFTRNLSNNPGYAQGILAGMIGMIRFFSFHQRFGAVVSLLEMGWQICAQAITDIHPITKGLISFVSTIMAPSPARRSLWMARNQEIFQTTSERYFHLSTTAYFTAAYYALTTGDEDSLLYYLSQLEDHLAPRDPESNAISGPFYDDPSLCLGPVGPKKADFLGYHPETSSPSSSTTTELPFVLFPACSPKETPLPSRTPSPPSSASNPSFFPSFFPTPISALETSTAPMSTLDYATPSCSHHSCSSSCAAAPLPTSSPCAYNPLSPPLAPPTSSDPGHISAFSYGYLTPYTVPFHEESSEATSDEVAINTSTNSFIPNEDFKTVLRSASHLLRAEAALLSKNYATCRHWVDEAEREITSVPDIFFQHKVFLVDVTLLKTIFRTTCPFPTGNHSVAEEFEMRVRAESDRRVASAKHDAGLS